MTVTDAMDLAAEGKIADGYACLLWGLHRAEEMIEAGKPWAEELRERWQTAVDNYCTRYGVKLND